jgi:small-conductance mechanosensitive channel
VIASKELILCLSGAVLRISGSGFGLGDRIEIAGIRGDVIDIGALTTTVLEVGPGPAVHKSTGRTVVLPNSHFLLHPVTNETFTGPFVLHATTLPLSASEDWQDAERRLLEAARQECSSYLDDARANMEKLGRKHGLLPPSVEPQSWLRVPKPQEIELIVRFPAPARLRGQVEQAILRRFFEAAPSAPRRTTDPCAEEAR